MNSNRNNIINGSDSGDDGRNDNNIEEDDRKPAAKIDINSDCKVPAKNGVDNGTTIATVTPMEKYCNIDDYFDDDAKQDTKIGFKTAAKMLEEVVSVKKNKDVEKKIINPYTINKKPRLAVETADTFDITHDKLLKLIQLFNTKRDECLVCKVCNVSDSAKKCSDTKNHPGIVTRAETFQKSVYDKTKRPFIENVACFSRGCYVPIGICASPTPRKKGYHFVDKRMCNYPDIIMNVVYISKEVYGQDVTKYLNDTIGSDDTAMLTKVCKSNGTYYLLLHRVFVEIYELFIRKV
jgi:hypothetical protein